MPKGIAGKITIVCARCGETKTHRARGMCDACWQADRLERLKARGDFYVDTPKTKVCQRCKKQKATNAFSKNTNTKDRLQAWCNDCLKVLREEKKNSPEWREKNRTRMQVYYANLPAERKAEISERNYKRQKERMKTDTEYHKRKNFQLNQKYIRRKRLKGQSRENYTQREWQALCKQYDYKCLRCKQKFTLELLTADHVLPLTMNGENTIENIQPLCRSCNSKKNNRHIDYRPK